MKILVNTIKMVDLYGLCFFMMYTLKKPSCQSNILTNKFILPGRNVNHRMLSAHLGTGCVTNGVFQAMLSWLEITPQPETASHHQDDMKHF